MGADYVSAIVAKVQGVRRPIILIDGGSGSGKTELARRLSEAMSAQLVHLDDVYPGWGGLDAGSAAVADDILRHHRWQRWDWDRGEFAEWIELNAKAPLVVEGSGALSRENRTLATFGIWVELDEPTRKARAIARDGEDYAIHWDEWAAQELAFFQRERPDLLADMLIVG